MKKLLLLLFCFPTLAMAQLTAIPDTNFELALIALGYDVLPLNGSVPTANINTVTTLDVSDENIYDLKGIEDFVALIDLDCSLNHYLVNILLHNNTLLQTLDFSWCDLNSINLLNNTALTWIDGSAQGVGANTNSGLDTIDVSNCLLLNYLDISHNELSYLDVTNNIYLQKLDAYSNDIDNLDVTQNGWLTHWIAVVII